MLIWKRHRKFIGEHSAVARTATNGLAPRSPDHTGWLLPAFAWQLVQDQPAKLTTVSSEQPGCSPIWLPPL